ncbi:Protein fam49a [Nowakowskiella sp. JEL0078]|nr:Protein fam49a [Nowakowskiella sp. JEL0078]
MGNPNIQNDFSYYRRTLSKIKMTTQSQQNVVVQDELANRMSLFYAHSAPMMKSLVDSIGLLVKSNEGVPLDNILECLSCISAVCYNAITKGRAADAKMLDFCIRVLASFKEDRKSM